MCVFDIFLVSFSILFWETSLGITSELIIPQTFCCLKQQYDFIVSVGQEFRLDSPGCLWIRISHDAMVKLSAGAVIISSLNFAENSHPNLLTYSLADLRSTLAIGLETSVSSPVNSSIFSCMTAWFLQGSKKERERTREL